MFYDKLSGQGGDALAGRGRQPRPVGLLLATIRTGYYLTQNLQIQQQNSPSHREETRIF